MIKLYPQWHTEVWFISMEQTVSRVTISHSAGPQIPHFFGNRRFITVLKESATGPKPDESISHPFTLFI
jgi:hypothetical protein